MVNEPLLKIRPSESSTGRLCPLKETSSYVPRGHDNLGVLVSSRAMASSLAALAQAVAKMAPRKAAAAMVLILHLQGTLKVERSINK